MSEENRSVFDQRKEARDAYKKGVREGWDQAAWAGIAICILIYFLIEYFPA